MKDLFNGTLPELPTVKVTEGYTDYYKEQHIDDLYEWVMDKKHDEMNYWAQGIFFEDNYEDVVEGYVEDKLDELWQEYFHIYGTESSYPKELTKKA